VVAVVAGLVVWQVAGGDESDDSGSTDNGNDAATLPQGDPLDDDVLLWVVRDDSGNTRLQAGVPGTGPTELASLGDEVRHPVLTEDRRTLFYREYDRNTDRATLWVAGSGGEDRKQIIDDPDCPQVGRPSVNPDATEVAVTCPQVDGPNLPGIRIYSVDGDLLRTLDAGHITGGPMWSADGSTIVYWRQDGSGTEDPGGDIYAIGAHDEDGEGDRLTRGSFLDEQPVLTPDLRTMTFVRHPEDDPEVSRLYRMDLVDQDGSLAPGGDAEPLSSPDDTSDTGPALSPEGSELAFTRDGVLFTMPLADGAGSPEPAPSPPDEPLNLAWARR
jgi:hypothetical protein